MTEIHQTAIIEEGAEIGEDVSIGPYSVISANAKIGDGAKLMSHVVIEGHTKLGRGCKVFPFACIGAQTQDLKYSGGTTYVEVGENTVIRENVTINSGTHEGEVTRVGSGCLIMAYAHIAHACVVGDEVIMANCATLAGDVQVEDKAVLGGLSAVHQFVRVGKMCMVGGCTKITQDCPPFMIVDGNPAVVRGLNSIGLKRRGIDSESQKGLKEAFKVIYKKDLSTSQAMEEIKNLPDMSPELEHLVSFVEKSERGIIK
ncbi:acyl-[acyl-carrier-protein]--UDP-N-acetylglucosamine O-acyltransferase [bacterium E08(2017)]|nr:acyl-[acyl-carrier-protein]--UDP-N-acetylglucosamine O-acyltransferase [bacterium E08(2017)]